MTETKAKYDYWNYLIYSQLVEILKCETPAQKTKEAIDLIHVLIRYVEKQGYNPAEIYEKRIEDKSKHWKEITTKYYSKYKAIMEQMEEEERNGD